MRWVLALVTVAACDLTWNNDFSNYYADAAGGAEQHDARASDASIDGGLGADAAGHADAAMPPNVPLGSFAQQAYVKAAATTAYDWFGSGVAVTSDGSRLAVAKAGRVEVFVRNGTTWSFDSSITVATGPSGFGGNPIGISGDGTRIVAGVTSVAAYVYVRSGAGWTQEAQLVQPNQQSLDFFGATVAISRDGTTVVVGAYDEDSTNEPGNDQTFAGAAHVFTRTGTTWTYRQRILSETIAPGDYFGGHVAVSADGATIAVGSTGKRTAYVFVRSGTAWLQQAGVQPVPAVTHFGWSVVLSDDGNTLAVGAYCAASCAGAAYVFTRATAMWSERAALHAPNGDTNDLYGFSVALSADGTRLAIGAPGEGSASALMPLDNSRYRSGAAYMARSLNNVWEHTAYVKASNPDAEDFFGRVALSADGVTLAVGAHGEESNATGVGGNQTNNSVYLAGAAYVFAEQ